MIRQPPFTQRRILPSIPSRHFLSSKISSKFFHMGERFTGSIIEIANGGQVTVSARGKIFNAFTSEKLEKGGVYEFVVSRTWPRIELKIVSRSGTHDSSPLRLWISTKKGRENFFHEVNEVLTLSKAKGLSKSSIVALGEMLDLMQIPYGDKPNTLLPERIAGFLLASGLFFESRLARFAQSLVSNKTDEHINKDLKGILLTMIQALEKDDFQGKESSGLYQRLVQLVHLIEGHQILNLNAIQANMGWFWFIPFYDGHRWDCAELLTKKTSEKSYGIWISIRLSQLGLVQAKIELAESSVRVSFYLAEDSKKEFVSSNLTELKQRFEAQGLVLVSFECKRMEEEGIALSLSSPGQGGGFSLEV